VGILQLRRPSLLFTDSFNNSLLTTGVPMARTNRKHRFNSCSIVECRFIAAERCLRRRCVATVASRTTEDTASNSFSVVARGFLGWEPVLCVRARARVCVKALLSNGSTRYAILTPFTLHSNCILCGVGFDYLHRSPVSRKKRRKGNPVPGGITGPPCSWGM
jgi:hypothetical protein